MFMFKSKNNANIEALQEIYDEAYQNTVQATLFESQGNSNNAISCWKKTLTGIDSQRKILSDAVHKSARERALYTNIITLELQSKKHIHDLYLKLHPTSKSSDNPSHKKSYSHIHSNNNNSEPSYPRSRTMLRTLRDNDTSNSFVDSNNIPRKSVEDSSSHESQNAAHAAWSGFSSTNEKNVNAISNSSLVINNNSSIENLNAHYKQHFAHHNNSTSYLQQQPLPNSSFSTHASNKNNSSQTVYSQSSPVDLLSQDKYDNLPQDTQVLNNSSLNALKISLPHSSDINDNALIPSHNSNSFSFDGFQNENSQINSSRKQDSEKNKHHSSEMTHETTPPKRLASSRIFPDLTHLSNLGSTIRNFGSDNSNNEHQTNPSDVKHSSAYKKEKREKRERKEKSKKSKSKSKSSSKEKTKKSSRSHHDTNRESTDLINLDDDIPSKNISEFSVDSSKYKNFSESNNNSYYPHTSNEIQYELPSNDFSLQNDQPVDSSSQYYNAHINNDSSNVHNSFSPHLKADNPFEGQYVIPTPTLNSPLTIGSSTPALLAEALSASNSPATTYDAEQSSASFPNIPTYSPPPIPQPAEFSYSPPVQDDSQFERPPDLPPKIPQKNETKDETNSDDNEFFQDTLSFSFKDLNMEQNSNALGKDLNMEQNLPVSQKDLIIDDSSPVSAKDLNGHVSCNDISSSVDSSSDSSALSNSNPTLPASATGHVQSIYQQQRSSVTLKAPVPVSAASAVIVNPSPRIVQPNVIQKAVKTTRVINSKSSSATTREVATKKQEITIKPKAIRPPSNKESNLSLNEKASSSNINHSTNSSNSNLSSTSSINSNSTSNTITHRTYYTAASSGRLVPSLRQRHFVPLSRPKAKSPPPAVIGAKLANANSSSNSNSRLSPPPQNHQSATNRSVSSNIRPSQSPVPSNGPNFSSNASNNNNNNNNNGNLNNSSTSLNTRSQSNKSQRGNSSTKNSNGPSTSKDNSTNNNSSKPNTATSSSATKKEVITEGTDNGLADNDDDKCGNDNLQAKEDEKKIKELLKKVNGIDEKIVRQIFNEIVVHGDEVHWSDIAGLETAKNSLKETVVYPFLRPDLFSGLREPARGMLLFGPPGTGKTMLARAVATESKSTFFSLSASSLTSKYFGESEKLVRALFILAKELAPSIIFVDEIDSLLAQRSDNGEHESSRRIKTEFLIQWSDLQHAAAGKDHGNDAQRVLVLAATNLPWVIDEAARRRFVRRQYIPLPERYTREAQLLTLLAHQNISLTKYDIEGILNLTEGFSGSDMTALAKDAAMGPLRELGERLLDTPGEHIRPISYIDFVNSLKYIRPSVSKDGLKAYEDWAKQFGSSGV